VVLDSVPLSAIDYFPPLFITHSLNVCTLFSYLIGSFPFFSKIKTSQTKVLLIVFLSDFFLCCFHLFLVFFFFFNLNTKGV